MDLWVDRLVDLEEAPWLEEQDETRIGVARIGGGEILPRIRAQRSFWRANFPALDLVRHHPIGLQLLGLDSRTEGDPKTALLVAIHSV